MHVLINLFVCRRLGYTSRHVHMFTIVITAEIC